MPSVPHCLHLHPKSSRTLSCLSLGQSHLLKVWSLGRIPGVRRPQVFRCRWPRPQLEAGYPRLLSTHCPRVGVTDVNQRCRPTGPAVASCGFWENMQVRPFSATPAPPASLSVWVLLHPGPSEFGPVSGPLHVLPFCLKLFPRPLHGCFVAP